MGSDIGIVSQCPHCRRGDRIIRAVDARPESKGAAEDGQNGADLALPAYEWWSLLLIGALALLMLGAACSGGNVSTDDGNVVSDGLMLLATPLALLGLPQTWRNRKRMRAVEATVRGYHEAALYCEDCGYLHFRPGDVPPGFEPHSVLRPRAAIVLVGEDEDPGVVDRLHHCRRHRAGRFCVREPALPNT